MFIAPKLLAPLLFALAASGCSIVARDDTAQLDTPRHGDTGVVGIQSVHLHADYWIHKQGNGGRVVFDAAAIAAQNARLRAIDKSVNDIEQLPATLDGAHVRAWIEDLSRTPVGPLFDIAGSEVPPATMTALRASLDLDAIPAQMPTRYGLVTHRADLRTFPTTLRVFKTPGNTDIDRFQESALFPGTPVALVHASRDGEWWFVVSELYEAWIEKRMVAEGSSDEVFGYGRKTPFLVVTGANVRTTFTPELPQASELLLDMGVRVPVLASWPANLPVNGQHPYTAHVLELPIRDLDGTLSFAPALLPRSADVASDYLPLSREGLLRQSFKFLGERYGWGHSWNARDCSGFVAEVYRSFGVILPRNTGDQELSPALNRLAFGDSMDHAARIKVLRTLDVGDLVYVPGHVMMVIGHEQGLPYVIHDTAGINYLDEDGKLERSELNGVAVTPLAPLMTDTAEPLIDRITSVQRIRR